MRNASMGATLAGWGGVLAFLIVWEAIVRSGLATFEYLPAPSTVVVALGGLLVSATFWAEIGHTLQAALLGWIIAGVAGVALGLALGLSRATRRWSLATIEVLRPLPGVAFAPVALLLFGFSLQTELLVIVAPALWPVLVNTMGGIASMPPRLAEVARTLRLDRRHAVTSVFIPAAAPAILVGLRLALTLAVVMAVIAEMIANPQGLGYAVVRAQQALKPAEMFAYVFVIGMLGIVANSLLQRVARLALPGTFGRTARPIAEGA